MLGYERARITRLAIYSLSHSMRWTLRRPLSQYKPMPPPQMSGGRRGVTMMQARPYMKRALKVAAITAGLVVAYDMFSGSRKASTASSPALNSVDAILRHSEASHFPVSPGIVRFDTNQVASNDPIEDERYELVVKNPANTGYWTFFGIYDGHSGRFASEMLRDWLIPYVCRELEQLYRDIPPASVPIDSAVDDAISRAFEKLDTEIVSGRVNALLGKDAPKLEEIRSALMPAISGSCALLGFYDSESQLLKLAVTGDSRAVFGSRDATRSTWEIAQLTLDQTGRNKYEQARLASEHPGETVIVNGRVLGGLEPTRAFGDAKYKWTADMYARLASAFGFNPAHKMSRMLKSPPYVTARPEISTIRLDASKGGFLVLASDGLWDMLSNEDVGRLMCSWIDSNSISARPHWPKRFLSFFGADAAKAASSGSDIRTDSGADAAKVASSGSEGASANDASASAPNAPNAPKASKDAASAASASKTPQVTIPYDAGNSSSVLTKKMVCRDENAATHLIRNALGGGDEDYLASLLSLKSPVSRRYRDDLTVTVVFFGPELVGVMPHKGHVIHTEAEMDIEAGNAMDTSNVITMTTDQQGG